MGRIEVLLTAILRALDKPKLGFSDWQGIVHVFCNRQHSCNWYTLQNGQPVPIPFSALTGYLVKLEINCTERGDRESTKLLTTIQADQTYVLESGYDSFFSKGLLMAVSLIHPQDLLKPITIQPYEGGKKTVLFCKVWVEDALVFAAYGEDTNWHQVANKAMHVVKSIPK